MASEASERCAAHGHLTVSVRVYKAFQSGRVVVDLHHVAIKMAAFGYDISS